MQARFLCPVCGYPDLYDEPWTDGSPSDEICPSCGTQFGYDDAGMDAAAITGRHAQLRQEWRASGCRWFSSSRLPPASWDPSEQLVVFDE